MALNGRNAGGSERDPRLDFLYGEGGREDPPAHLDAAILAAAHREVGARPRPLSSALRRWRVPVSIAALVILSVSLVTLVREEGRDALVQVAPSAPPPPQPRETTPPPAPRPAQADVARATAPAPAASPAPAGPALRDDRRVDAPGELGKMADRAQRESVSAAASGAGTAAMPEPAAKPSPQPVPSVEDSSARAPAVAAQRSARPSAAGGPAPEPEGPKALAKTMQAAVPGQGKALPWQGYEKEPPQKWLDRIAELRRQGESVAAGEMLAEFKRRFPDHPLPPDLGAR